MKIFWRIIGIALILWVAWDIYYEYTFIYHIVYRTQDPVLYWTAIVGWSLLGISCFFVDEKNPTP